MENQQRIAQLEAQVRELVQHVARLEAKLESSNVRQSDPRTAGRRQ